MRRGRGIELACVAWYLQGERGHASERAGKTLDQRQGKSTLTPVLDPGFAHSLGQISHALYDVGGEYRRNM